MTPKSEKIKFVALAVIKLHLPEGRQAGRQAGRQYKIPLNYFF